MTPSGPKDVWTIVVAAGSGQRFGGSKQFEVLAGRTVAEWATHTASAFSGGVVVVVPADCELGQGPVQQVHGGASRSESVRRGLAAVPNDARVICVHDAARPFAPDEVFQAVIAAVRNGADAAVPGLAVADTIKQVDEHDVVVHTPPRDRLRAVQTPQAFAADVLRRVHQAGGEASDDAALVEAHGGRVVVVPGHEFARKITTRDDMEWARAHAADQQKGEV